ncbi:hypothetical protein PF010_g19885 [Phytophthora fragariae]|uniref:Uncharacterized protein n=1 Tax=Phytophthora fragariae TaxID=53985 RepID=A0A6G0NA03_9STRA|nr:hypothetical protein PF010_g19885 [Phytophthora fragariae]KAE9199121.1 hypothetical protein PF004_g19354 [Phytophthora fragariae]
MPCTGGGAHKYGYAFNEMAKRLSWRRATRLIYTTFEVVDLNSLAASRVKIIQTKIYTRICLVLALVLVYCM